MKKEECSLRGPLLANYLERARECSNTTGNIKDTEMCASMPGRIDNKNNLRIVPNQRTLSEMS